MNIMQEQIGNLQGGGKQTIKKKKSQMKMLEIKRYDTKEEFLQ